MRPDLMDENKIIKRTPLQNAVREGNPPLEDKNNNTDNTLDVINTNQISENENHPQFSYARNPITKKVEITNAAPSIGIPTDIDIPKDHLKLMYVNTKKYVEELMLDIKILKLLISGSNNNINYKNKFDYLTSELEFSTYKLDVLTKLIK